MYEPSKQSWLKRERGGGIERGIKKRERERAVNC